MDRLNWRMTPNTPSTVAHHMPALHLRMSERMTLARNPPGVPRLGMIGEKLNLEEWSRLSELECRVLSCLVL